MKNNVLLLLKTNILNMYKFRSINKKKAILTSVLIIYVIVTLMTSAGALLNNMFNLLNKLNITSYYVPLIFIIMSLFSFFFTIFASKSWLFDNKDNDMLLSLPIKKGDVLISRFLQLFIYSFLIGLIILIPGIYIYVSNVGITLYFVINLIFFVLLFSIIPTILSSLFGYLIAFITSNLKHKNVAELISYVLFIGIYMLFANGANKLLIKLTSNLKLLNTLLKTCFLPIYLMIKSLETGNVLYLISYILINVLILYLFRLLFKNKYFKIISKLNSHVVSSNFKMGKLRSQNINKALRIKELKRYFSSAIYVFNTIFGMFIILIAAIATTFYSYDKLISMINIDFEVTPFILVLMLVLLSISFTNTTNSSISIERENFWILKMIPVETKNIFNAKKFVNEIIIIPITIISLIIFKINGYINITELLLLSLIVIVYASFISNFGLIANLLFPKFDAINDTVVVKQSVASFMGIMGGLVIFIILVGIVVSLNLSNTMMLCITLIMVLILMIISKIIISKWGINRFKTLG